jgi:hypothetical protein
VRAVAVERKAEGGQKRDEGLAFAGGHFGEPTLGEGQASDELDIVRRETVHAAHGLRDKGDGLGGEIRARDSRAGFGAQRGGAFTQALSGFAAERGEMGL